MPHSKQTNRTDCPLQTQPTPCAALLRLKAAIQAEREAIFGSQMQDFSNRAALASSHLAQHRARISCY